MLCKRKSTLLLPTPTAQNFLIDWTGWSPVKVSKKTLIIHFSWDGGGISRWFILRTTLLDVQNKNQEVVRLNSDCTSAYLGHLPDTRCTGGNSKRLRGRIEKNIWEADLNKQPRDTANDHLLSQVWMSPHKEWALMNKQKWERVCRN